MKAVMESVKIDQVLEAQAINNTNVTGRYYKLEQGRRACFLLNGAAMAAAKTTKLELLQTTEPVLAADATAVTGAEDTITANLEVIEATAALATAAATDVIEVNGVEFTMAAATVVADKEFLDAAGLVLCINYWCAGVIASSSGTDVTVASENGGADVSIVKTEVVGTITLATTEHQIIVEIRPSQLDTENGFYYVAPKVTTTADTVAGVTLLLGDTRFAPKQIGGKTLL